MNIDDFMNLIHFGLITHVMSVLEQWKELVTQRGKQIIFVFRELEFYVDFFYRLTW
jgi:hypothetical protein